MVKVNIRGFSSTLGVAVEVKVGAMVKIRC